MAERMRQHPAVCMGCPGYDGAAGSIKQVEACIHRAVQRGIALKLRKVLVCSMQKRNPEQVRRRAQLNQLLPKEVT